MTARYCNSDLGNIIAQLNESTFSICPLGTIAREGQTPIVTAQFKQFRLRTRLLPVTVCATGEVLGYVARLRIYRGQARVNVEELYAASNDRDDVVLLDRLCRALHALNYVACRATGLLFVDVRSAFVDAVPDGHGQVFESILGSCGIATQQVVIQLLADDAQSDRFVQAIRNYRSRGYRIGVLASSTTEASDWIEARHWVDFISLPKALIERAEQSAGTRRHLALLLDLSRELNGGEFIATDLCTSAQMAVAVELGLLAVHRDFQANPKSGALTPWGIDHRINPPVGSNAGPKAVRLRPAWSRDAVPFPEII